MFLSCSGKKGTKEAGIGEALRKSALPYVPHPPHRHPASKNVPIFERLQIRNLLICTLQFYKNPTLQRKNRNIFLLNRI